MFSTSFILVDLLVENEWTVREALPWVFKSFSFGIWYSTLFTPLVIYSIINCGLFNKFNCNRDPRTFSRHALCMAVPQTPDIFSMDPLTVRPFISLDMISSKACKRTIRSTEVYLTRHLQTITHLLSTQSYSRFHFCTNRYLNRQNWSTVFHQVKIFMSNHFMISPFQNPIFGFESVLLVGYRLFPLANCSILTAVYRTRPEPSGPDLISSWDALRESMRKVSQDESFVFVSSNWRRNHFTHFTHRLIEREEKVKLW